MKERIDPWHRQRERFDAVADEFRRLPCPHWANEVKQAVDAVMAVMDGKPVRVPVVQYGVGMSDKTAFGEPE